MRILVLSPAFHPVIGGAERYAHTISSELSVRGHTVHVVTDEPRGLVTDDAFGFTVHRLSGYLAGLTAEDKLRWEEMAFGLAPELTAIAEQVRPDVVISNSLDTAIQAAMLALHREIPWVAAFHEQEPENMPLGIGRLKMIYGRLRPDLVLAGSEFYAERARRYGAPGRVAMIHHGVPDLADAGRVDAHRFRDRYNCGSGNVLVVCAGRLKRRKGMLELVEAFHQVHRTHEASRLVLAGSVSSASRAYADSLAASIDHHGLSEVAMIDETVRLHEMPGLLTAADVVAQPSYEEGLGLSVLEAMILGRAVITTDIPGTREILTTPGIAEVVVPGDVPALAAALEKMVTDPKHRAGYGESAMRHAKANFSVRRMIDLTEAELHRVSAVTRKKRAPR